MKIEWLNDEFSDAYITRRVGFFGLRKERARVKEGLYQRDGWGWYYFPSKNAVEDGIGWTMLNAAKEAKRKATSDWTPIVSEPLPRARLLRKAQP